MTARSVARIARSVALKNEETKCFSQQIAAAVSATNVWQFASAMAGLVQGTGPTARVGNKIHIVALEYFVWIVPAVLNVGVNGSLCRVIFYHNRDAQGTTPNVATLWDNNQLVTGRNVNWKDAFSIHDDITHQMTITSNNGGTKFSAGPALFKCFRFPLGKDFVFNANGGTISDLYEQDYGMGFCTDGVNCCSVTCNVKIWFKDA